MENTNILTTLETLHNGTLCELAQRLDCGVSKATLSRMLNGERVRPHWWRKVADALGIEYEQRPSWQRRRELRAACRAAGLTVEDAAELYLRGLTK